jgi:hypothetical protein
MLDLVDRFNLPGKGTGWRGARGNMGIWAPASGILLVQLSGFGEEAYAEHVIEGIDRPIARGDRLRLFIDMEGMTNYDSALRTKLTTRLLQCREQIDSMVVLAKSRIVTMGVSVANLALGGIISAHEDRDEFAKAFESELRKSGVVGFSVGVLHTAASKTVR